jgi:hypothetical protein
MRLCMVAVSILCLVGCSAGSQCDLMKRQDFESPDGRHIAVVFEVCCYDTTGFYPHVSVLRPGQKLGKAGNVFSGGAADSFRVSWTSADSLLLEYRPDGDLAYPPPASTNIDGVRVTLEKYKEMRRSTRRLTE